MRRFLLPLATLLALTPFAHADTFDDLTITGNGHVLTFTLPSTSSMIEYYRQDNIVFIGGNSGVIDGVAGQRVLAVFRLGSERFYGSFSLSIGTDGYNFFGDYPINATQVPYPDYPFPYYDLVTANLIPGTYQLYTVDYTIGLQTPYTLTITPEAATATPEPSTLALLATGSLRLLTRMRRRTAPAQKHMAQSPQQIT